MRREATPRAKLEAPDQILIFVRCSGLDSIKDRVTSPPEHGRRNRAVLHRLRERYGEKIRQEIVAKALPTQITDQEIRAYKIWATGQPRARALALLERELNLRERDGIYNPRPRRRTPESWELLAGELGV